MREFDKNTKALERLTDEDKIKELGHGDVKFESASKLSDGTYEIRGKDARGKRYEIEIHPDGKVNLD